MCFQPFFPVLYVSLLLVLQNSGIFLFLCIFFFRAGLLLCPHLLYLQQFEQFRQPPCSDSGISARTYKPPMFSIQKTAAWYPY